MKQDQFTFADEWPANLILHSMQYFNTLEDCLHAIEKRRVSQLTFDVRPIAHLVLRVQARFPLDAPTVAPEAPSK